MSRRDKQTIIEVMDNNPVIAAIGNEASLKEALESPCEVMFLLQGSLKSLKHYVNLVHEAGKVVFVHVDLMKGLAHDVEGLEYLWYDIMPDGIISTKSQVIRKAKDLGFVTVQRIFVLDSKSIERGIRQLREIKPDYVEVMPGAMDKIIRRIASMTKVPLIAGGLIDEKDEVISLLKSGATSISTSAQSLWDA